MKNILVTGGSGFVGSNLTLELQKRYPKARITVMDDFRCSSFKNLLGFRGDVVATNVADKTWMPILEKQSLDAIFHLASITDTTVLDEKKMMVDNVEGFRNILELGRRTKAVVVYASSAAVYGDGPQPKHGKKNDPASGIAFKETEGGLPNNIYGFSKWTLENLARFSPKKLRHVGLRYFNVFGPRETFKGNAASMIYQLYLQMKAGKRPRIFKFGEQKRDFVYVKDIVEATILAAGARESTVVNVGTGKATAFNALVASLNEALGTSLEPDYFDNPYNFYQNFTQADLTHTRKAIGYKPQFTTHAGILDYVRTYLEPQITGSKIAVKI